MAEGEILDYLTSNNNDVVIEDSEGKGQRGILVATPGGFAGGGSAYVSATPFELGITQGRVTGYSWNDKFGVNDVITSVSDPEDVIEIGGIYPEDAFGTAPVVSIASTSPSDVGVHVKCNLGLDIDGNKVSDTYILNGTSRVALTTPLWKALSFECFGSQLPVGDIFIYTGTGAVPSLGDPEVRNYINPDDRRTNLMYTTIPAGKVGYLYKGELGMELTSGGVSSAEYARCRYQSARVGEMFTTKKNITLINNGDSVYVDIRDFPDPIPALTSFKLNVKEVSDTMGVWGTATYLIVDEGELSPEYLSSIGQPGY